MVHRLALCAAALMSCIFIVISAVAVAAEAPQWSVSGPANGTNIIPSTAYQKEGMFEGRSVSPVWSQQTAELMGSLIAVGAPGIEGAPGTESGR
jgi:hypothetical protein